MKTYTGSRTIFGANKVLVDGTPLEERLDLKGITDRGFDWAHEGAAPAQLALALLADHLGDDAAALRLHEAFMRGVVAYFADDWEMTGADIDAYLVKLEKLQQAAYDQGFPQEIIDRLSVVPETNRGDAHKATYLGRKAKAAAFLTRHGPLLAMLFGTGLLFIAMVHDVLFAGLPYQDPPSDLQADLEARRGITALLAWGGVVFAASGALAAIVRRLRRFRFRPTPPGDGPEAEHSTCCDSKEWIGVADFDRAAGFDFYLGRCANCSSYLLSVSYADWPTLHVLGKQEAEEFLRLKGTPMLRKALRRWVGEV